MIKIRVCYPDSIPEVDKERSNKSEYKIFLGGSLDSERDWQDEIIEFMKFSINLETKDLNELPADVTIFCSKNQDDYGKELKWDLDRMNDVNLIIFYLTDSGDSTKALIEFGQILKSRKLLFICDSKSYQFNKIKEICKQYSIPMIGSIDEFYKELIKVIE